MFYRFHDLLCIPRHTINHFVSGCFRACQPREAMDSTYAELRAVINSREPLCCTQQLKEEWTLLFHKPLYHRLIDKLLGKDLKVKWFNELFWCYLDIFIISEVFWWSGDLLYKRPDGSPHSQAKQGNCALDGTWTGCRGAWGCQGKGESVCTHPGMLLQEGNKVAFSHHWGKSHSSQL